MTQMISESLCGFLRGHFILNIRLVLDLLDYGDRIKHDGSILFLDCCKASDKVMLVDLEHVFIG